MTVAYRGISSRVGGNGTTITLTNDVPGLTDGDFMLMAVFGNLFPATPPQPPAGWTLIDKEDSGNFYLHIYGRLAASEPGAYTITRGSSGQTYAAALLVFYSTVGKPLYVDAHANQINASSTNRTFPGVTTTQASAGLACFSNSGTNNGSTPPGDMTERWDELSASANRIYAMSSILSVAGATGNKIATSGIAIATRTVTVAVAESSGTAGALAQTLAAVTLAAAGQVQVSGALAQTLDAVTVAATGQVQNGGALAQTLDSVTLAATGQVQNGGALAQTLDAVTVAATGQVQVRGALARTLDAATLAAAALVIPHAGMVTQTLAAVTLAATGLRHPLTPTGVTATPLSPSQIQITWVHGGADVDGFQVETSVDGLTAWTNIATTGAAARSFTHSGLAEESLHYYRVRAFRES